MQWLPRIRQWFWPGLWEWVGGWVGVAGPLPLGKSAPEGHWVNPWWCTLASSTSWRRGRWSTSGTGRASPSRRCGGACISRLGLLVMKNKFMEVGSTLCRAPQGPPPHGGPRSILLFIFNLLIPCVSWLDVVGSRSQICGFVKTCPFFGHLCCTFLH